MQELLHHLDVKVKGGNNRQLDLLAYNLLEDAQYHIEASVTHELIVACYLGNVGSEVRGKILRRSRAKTGSKY